MPKYSIVVPLHNEQENVTDLYDRLKAVMEAHGESFEIVLVDDGSADHTFAMLREIAAVDSRVTVVKLRRNFGQTAGLAAGFDHARGEYIIAMDGDLQHDPNDIPLFLEKIAAAYGTRKFAETFRKLYPKCENISIDYAVLEPRSAKGEAQSRIFCLPSDFGWNDLGSWTALHEHHTAKSSPVEGNIIDGAGVFVLNANGNYVHAPGKFVAAIGVSNLVVVDTPDALLITTRQNAQDVGKVVKHLDEKRLHKLT